MLNCEALTVVKDVSRVWSVYLLGWTFFSVVIDHGTLKHLLKQPSDKINARQGHLVERLMPFAQSTSILYRKGSMNEADPLSSRLFFPIRTMSNGAGQLGCLLSGGMVMYLICVIKTMIPHC